MNDYSLKTAMASSPRNISSVAVNSSARVKGKIMEVPVENIFIAGNMPNTTNHKYVSIKNNMKSTGLYDPFVVIRSKENINEFILFSDARYLKAAIDLGYSKVQVVVKDDLLSSFKTIVERDCLSNNIHPVEKGKMIEALLKNQQRSIDTALNLSDSSRKIKVTAEVIAQETGLSSGMISRYRLFANIYDEIADRLVSEDIRSKDLLVALGKVCRDSNEDKYDVVLQECNDLIDNFQRPKILNLVSLVNGDLVISNDFLKKLTKKQKSDLLKKLS